MSKLFRMALLKSKTKKLYSFLENSYADRLKEFYVDTRNVRVHKTSFSPNILHLGATAIRARNVYLCVTSYEKSDVYRK